MLLPKAYMSAHMKVTILEDCGANAIWAIKIEPKTTASKVYYHITPFRCNSNRSKYILTNSSY